MNTCKNYSRRKKENIHTVLVEIGYMSYEQSYR